MQRWVGVSSSVQGSDHIRMDLECQDASALVHLPGNYCFALVADGAGSALHAGDASRAAVDAVEGFLQRVFRYWAPARAADWEWVLWAGMWIARKRLERLAAERQWLLRSLHTTLLMVGVAEQEVWAANIGDGAAIVANEEGALHLLAEPYNGEYANEAFFLTGDIWTDDVHITSRKGRHNYAVAFSDGLQYVALHRKTPHEGFVAPIARILMGFPADQRDAELAGFISGHVIGKLTGDDVTLVVAWPEAVL